MEKGIVVTLVNMDRDILIRVRHPKFEEVAEITILGVDDAALLEAVKQGLDGRIMGGGWELKEAGKSSS